MRVDELSEANGGNLLPGSIETYLSREVPVCGPDDSAAQIRGGLVARRFAAVADVAVCVPGRDGSRRLLGLIPLASVICADPDVPASALMDPDPPVVAPGVDQEPAAWQAAQHGETSLAVVSSRGAFLGLVPPAKLLTVLLTEHDEDLARLGGYLRSSASARHALAEPVSRRLWHRMPWLILGLLGAAAAAVVVERFEPVLTRDVRLAFFIPGIVYLADAVGTQTETLVIRGLSIGVPLRRVFLAEAATGLAVGLTLALVSGPAAAWALGSPDIGLALGISVLAACSVATVLAMALPWAIDKLGSDPAFGSGPLATVVQDLLSLLIYFAVIEVVLS